MSAIYRHSCPVAASGSCPPTYAHAVPVPDYSPDLNACEELVESSFDPPPYGTNPIARVTSSSSDLSYYSSHSSAGSSRASTSTRPMSMLSAVPSAYAAVHATAGSTCPLLSTTTPPRRYVYTSGNVELDLGAREDEERAIPTYGRNATVRGVIRLKKMSHVQSILITLEGRAQTMIMQGGLASGHSAAKILDLSHTVYDASKNSGKGKEPAPYTFPFEFEFPSNMSGSSDPLPPTFRGVHPSMEGWIRYIVKVHVVKSGIWPRDTISTVVHYLPKYYLRPEALLWPAISLMDAKRFGLEDSKWKTSSATLLASDPSFPEDAQPQLSISIPRTAQAVSGRCFPLNVTLRIPGARPEVVSDYLDKLKIEMIKRTTLVASGNKSSQLVGFGKLVRQQVEKELVDSDTRIFRGGLKAGLLHGEASWRLGELMNVEYFVRVQLSPNPNKSPIFRHDEPVEMFSHGRDEYDCPIEVHDAPAYTLLLASSMQSSTAFLR